MDASADIGFFTPLALIGEDYGFPLFGTLHFVYLAYSALLTAIVVIVYRHMRKGTGIRDPRRKMMLAIPVVVIALKCSEISIMIARGTYNVFWWPLHPCNIMAVIALIYALFPTRRIARPLGEILYTIGLPGAISGLLFADWIKVSIPWNWFCLCGFTEHSLIVAFVLMLLVGRDLTPDIRRMWQPIAFCAICFFPIHRFNEVNGTNYWFINTPSPGSPLEIFAQWCGVPGFLIPYAILAITLWTLMYLPWAIVAHRKRVAASGGSASDRDTSGGDAPSGSAS